LNSRNLLLSKKSSKQLSPVMKGNTMMRKVSIYVTNNSTTTKKMKTKSTTTYFPINLSLKNSKLPSKNLNKTILSLWINPNFHTDRNTIWEKRQQISTCYEQKEKKNLQNCVLPNPWSIAGPKNSLSITDLYILAIKMSSTKRKKESKLKLLRSWPNRHSKRN